METLIIIPAIWLLCWLSVFLHEAGHWLGCRISGGKAKGKITVGSGFALIDARRFCLRILPVGGSFDFDNNMDKMPKAHALFMFAGGPLISLLLTVLFAVLRFGVFGASDDVPLRVTSFMLIWNLFQFLFTAVPMRYRLICPGKPSDGMQFLYVLKQKDTDGE